jgi:hypothetical protein
MSRRDHRTSIRLAVLDAAEALVLQIALERALEQAEPLRAREALARWLRQLRGAQLAGAGAHNVLNLDGSPHESTAIERVFVHWQNVMRKPRARLDGKRYRLIARRLAEYGESELLAAIDGCARSGFHMGENDDGRRYDDLALILRDAAHIEAFAETVERSTAPRPTSRPSFGAASREAQTRASLDDFLGKRGSDQ